MSSSHVTRLKGLLYALKRQGTGELLRQALHIYRTGGFRVLKTRTIAYLNRQGQYSEVFRPAPRIMIDERNLFCARPTVAESPIHKPRKTRILILSDTTLDQCIKYRITHKIETLKMIGIDVLFGRLGDIYYSINQLQYCSCVIFYRAPINDIFTFYYNEARRLGIPVGYDIDDPIFDASVLAENSGLRHLPHYILTGQVWDVASFATAISSTDFAIASTPSLAKMLKRSVTRMAPAKRGFPVFVWRNAADEQTLNEAAQILATSETCEAGVTDSIMTIGYFSGSLAHEGDFLVAAEQLDHVMEENEDVRLLIGGHAKNAERFSRFGERVTVTPYKDYGSYLADVAKCDLLIVPFSDDRFNSTKSVVRMLDAAMVERPVLASPVGDYAELIEHGVNGWLAGDTEWHEQLTNLIADKARLAKVGKQAGDFIREQHSTHILPADWSAGLAQAIGIS